MMDREKQIEEIFNIIVDGVIDGDDNNSMPTGNTCDNIARAIYNAGYRKENEVRKETAKEFSEKVKQAIVDNTYPYFDKNGKPVNIWNTDGFDKIDELLKEYEE